MTAEEYENLNNSTKEITIEMLEPCFYGTLIYGYDLSRNTIHVYVKDGQFHYFKYNYNEQNIDYRNLGKSITDIASIIPDKRVYPSCCNYTFCNLVKKMGYNIPFTNFDKNTGIDDYYGSVYQERKFGDS